MTLSESWFNVQRTRDSMRQWDVEPTGKIYRAVYQPDHACQKLQFFSPRHAASIRSTLKFSRKDGCEDVNARQNCSTGFGDWNIPRVLRHRICLGFSAIRLMGRKL